MSDFRPDLDAIWENVYETCRNKYNEASFHVQLECSSNVVGEKDIIYIWYHRDRVTVTTSRT